MIVLASILVGGIFGIIAAYFQSAPSLEQVNIRQDFTTYIYDVNNRLITDLFRENRIAVDISDTPETLRNAIIAIEDHQFYNHNGINFYALVRAIVVNIREGRRAQGGSTLTMQLAHNVFLTQDKLFTRKFEEFLWAVQIERKYAKDEILEAYINEIYLGHGAYGMEAGAQTYFGKSVGELTLGEAAMIAGIIRWPARYSPFVNPDIAVQRRDLVLNQMVELGFVSPGQAKEARAEEVSLAERRTRVVSAPYFVDYILQQLIHSYGEETVFGGGLRVHTTLDLTLQKYAEEALLNNLPPGRTVDGGLTQPQGALVALEPSTGYIRAMVGGRGEDKFNRAVQALRSPGSAIKILGYTAAIDKGITPADVYIDEPTEFVLSAGNIWRPQNYSQTFLGPLTIREALERSTNIIAAKVVNELGLNTVIEYGKKMGISSFVESGRSNDLGLSPLALGGLTRGVSPLEMAAAYGVLANQGIYVAPISIVRVTDSSGSVLEENTPRRQVVLSEETSYIMTDMLRGVIENGTGTNARIGRPAAGKTGTHQDYRDAWFIGYTPDLAAAVWFGADNPERMVYQGVRYGSWNAATIWQRFMREAVKDTPVRDFEKPDGLVEGILIDKKTGLRVPPGCSLPPGEVREEIFLPGTEPREFSPRCR